MSFNLYCINCVNDCVQFKIYETDIGIRNFCQSYTDYYPSASINHEKHLFGFGQLINDDQQSIVNQADLQQM